MRAPQAKLNRDPPFHWLGSTVIPVTADLQQQHLYCGSCEKVQIDVHGGEVDDRPRRYGDVVESDYREILGNPQPGSTDRRQRTESEYVVRAD